MKPRQKITAKFFAKAVLNGFNYIYDSQKQLTSNRTGPAGAIEISSGFIH
jgi:hypothetical protein